MKRLLLAISAFWLSGAAMAAGGHAAPYSFTPDPNNVASLQRGARDFMAYCSGCHSLKYLRYNRVGEDLNIPADLLKANLMFTSDKPGDHIVSNIPLTTSKEWFGTTPPDLTLETRARGPSWVYSYLQTFYVDNSRPLGVNNLMLPGASMPHVLWELQGWQVKEEHAEGDDGHGHAKVPLKLVEQGKMSPDEYKKFVGDLVNFMAYAAEPGKANRISLGFKAMAYLFLLLALCYILKREFWRDVHH